MRQSHFLSFSLFLLATLAQPLTAHDVKTDAAREKAAVIEYFHDRVIYYQRDNRTPSLKAQIEDVKKDRYAIVPSEIDAILIDAIENRVLYLVTLPARKEKETRSLIGIVTASRKAKGELEAVELDEMKTPAEVIKLIR